MKTFLILCISVALFAFSEATDEKKNVLFIVVDDLRPDIGAYGQTYVHTPNIDQLAKESLVFDRAYCQQAICAPSRNSFMTGRRPDTTKAWNFIDHFREPGVGLNWTSLPQYFKKHGYFSSGVGKLYHPNLPPNFDPPSWSDLDKFPFVYPSPQGCPNHTVWCPLPRNGTYFSDVNSTEVFLKRLQYVAKSKEPFFLGIGFHKPHLSWRFPEEFLKYYPGIDNIAPAKHRLPPEGMPPVAWHECISENRYSDVHFPINLTTPFPIESQQMMRRAYYAATSFTDSLVGEILDSLKNLGLADNTIVSFHADHGWQLGEHNEWCKMTNFELATRVPLMIRVPWKKAAMGKKTNALAELVDLYPTLVDLAGLPPASEENLEGTSLAAIFDDVNRSVKNASLSQYPRCNPDPTSENNGCIQTNRTNISFMGYSMRTDRYRYTEWVKWNGTKLKPEWENHVGVELYDHQNDDETDFDAFENVNIASKNPSVVKMLSKQLHNLVGH